MKRTPGTLLFLTLLSAPPAMAEPVKTWFGGGGSTGLQVVQGRGAGLPLSQVEFDMRLSKGIVFFRLDLDYHFAPFFFAEDNKTYWVDNTPAFPIPPEYAMVQIGHKYHLRVGVTNAAIGIQGWDEKDNYFPTYSEGWKVVPSQNAGVEPGITFDSGLELFVWGGYDLGWWSPGAGAGVAYEGDFFGTWTGVYSLFFIDEGVSPYIGLVSANEIYPADNLWLTLELDGGKTANGLFGGGQVMATLFPENRFSGALRIDKQFMNQAAKDDLGVAMDELALSGVFRAQATDAIYVALEVKESWPTLKESPYFTGTLFFSAFVPEPGDPYAVEDEE